MTEHSPKLHHIFIRTEHEVCAKCHDSSCDHDCDAELDKAVTELEQGWLYQPQYQELP